MATANALCEFLSVDIVANGRVSDGGVFANSKFSSLYHDKQLNIPRPSCVSDIPEPLPYVFDAFPLGQHFMKTYSARNLSADEIHYNYRLSRARCVKILLVLYRVNFEYF